MQKPQQSHSRQVDLYVSIHIVTYIGCQCNYPLQSMSLMKITQPRAAVCSQRTTRRRVQDVGQYRDVISGGEGNQLLEREVTTLGVESRRQLEKAGITLTIPKEQGLAMKADLALPWNKMRELRRCNKPFKHIIACVLSFKVAESIRGCNGRREEATMPCAGVGGRQPYL